MVEKIIVPKIGLEEERFIGKPKGNLVNKQAGLPVNDLVIGAIHKCIPPDMDRNRFQREFDGSMVEYTSEPFFMDKIGEATDQLIMEQYVLAKTASDIGPNEALSLFPFSSPPFIDKGYAITLPNSKSNEIKEYYRKMRDTYGMDLVFVGRHMHFQMPDDLATDDHGIVLCRLGRDLVADTIALSASSPFYNGMFTGNQSERWLRFPKPNEIDRGGLYKNQSSFNEITQGLRNSGTIFRWPNHLYTPIRPKGDGRIEIRSFDLMFDRDYQLAVAIYFQLALLHLSMKYRNGNLNDYEYNESSVSIFRGNETIAAQSGGEAFVDKSRLWQQGRLPMKLHVKKVLEEIRYLVVEFGMERELEPLERFTLYGENDAVRMRGLYRGRYKSDFDSFTRGEIERYKAWLREETRLALARVNRNSSLTSQQLGSLIEGDFS